MKNKSTLYILLYIQYMLYICSYAYKEFTPEIIQQLLINILIDLATDLDKYSFCLSNAFVIMLKLASVH